MNTFWSYFIILLIGLAGGLVLFGVSTLLVFLVGKIYKGVRALFRLGRHSSEEAAWLPDEEAERQHEDELAVAEAAVEQPPVVAEENVIVPVTTQPISRDEMFPTAASMRLSQFIADEPVKVAESAGVLPAEETQNLQDDSTLTAEVEHVGAGERHHESVTDVDLPATGEPAEVDVEETTPTSENVVESAPESPAPAAIEAPQEPQESEPAPAAEPVKVGRFPRRERAPRAPFPVPQPQQPVAEDPLAELKRKLAGN